MYLLLRRPEDLPPSVGPRTRARVGVLVGLVVAALAVIFTRLWSLQVLSGNHYRTLAENNRVRVIRSQPPRGEILDRNGKVLVGNRTVLTLQLRPANLPGSEAARRRELARLAPVTGRSPADLERTIRISPQYAGYPIVLRQGLNRSALFFVLENRARLPGVNVVRTYARSYPDGPLAAHVLGITGQVSPRQLSDSGYRGMAPGDVVGQSGLEFAYDRYLRGTPGGQRIQVDALGRPKGELAAKAPRPGENLRLSLDAGLQATGEEALGARGLPGAFVAIDVHTGAVLAMGSHPTFDPSFYSKPHTAAEFRALENRSGAPLLDRADQGGYPTGSAFKPITATAALEDGLISPSTIVDDTGSLNVGGQVFHNAGGAVNGPVDMSTAIKVSSDVYFYRLGLEAKASGDRGQIQDWARAYGLGRKTGIDLPGEQAGLIPAPAWRDRVFRSRSNPYIDRPWTPGDNINLAVGQGDVEVTPLQLATAYAALANGGTVVTPHLGAQVEVPGGARPLKIQPPPRRHLKISALTRDTILGGMERAAMEPGGTSYPVFGRFPFPIAGKTGTAQRGAVADQSWYGAVAPYKSPRIVVVATVERGGFGVDAAAPVVARILERYFNLTQSTPLRGSAGVPF